MPGDFLLKAGRTAHRLLWDVSRRRLGTELGGMPILEVTTIGRRTGRKHTVMVAAPIADCETYVVVASRRGSPDHPHWYLNIQANPEVLVSVRGAPTTVMRARTASPNERELLWPRVVSSYPGYADDQSNTTRQFPVVLLSPPLRPVTDETVSLEME